MKRMYDKLVGTQTPEEAMKKPATDITKKEPSKRKIKGENKL